MISRGQSSPASSVCGRIQRYRFGIGVGGADWRQWHAVDLHVHWQRLKAEAATGGRRRAEVFSVCGTRTQYVRLMGRFDTDRAQQRCERCGWVVALNQGGVDGEIDLHVGAAGGSEGGLLRQVLTAILADERLPGHGAEAGVRSDLLAHASRHRPTAFVFPDPVLLCASCSFLAPGSRRSSSAPASQCVVEAPCSVLIGLARHYRLAFDERPSTVVR